MHTGEEKLRQLELIAYGCHRRVHQKIEKGLEGIKIESFTFYEYFLEKPQCLNNTVNDNIKLFCPFIKFYTMNLPLIPKEAKLKGDKLILNFIRRGDVQELEQFYKDIITIPASDFREIIDSMKNSSHESGNPLIKRKSLTEFAAYLKNVDSGKAKEFAYVNWIWYEYMKSQAQGTEPESQDQKPAVYFIYAPIKTSCILFGTLLLVISGDLQEESANKAQQILQEVADHDYAPLLLFFENAWQEKIARNASSEINNIFTEDCRPVEMANGAQDDVSRVELKLRKLWAARRQNRERGKQTLIMDKYFVASPGMVKTLMEIMNLNLQLGHDTDKPIPAVLIVGGPGTGKEKLAKIIGLFTEDLTYNGDNSTEFAEVKRITINMSIVDALRPRKDLHDIMCKKFSELSNTSGDLHLLLIFDELNSLSITDQGILLRLLENRDFKDVCPELTPDLIERLQNARILVIGIMNEDPELLTKSDALMRIASDERIFGGIIGDILYDYLKNHIRRLREDLYYRFLRGGVIRLPDLDARREDIPFLFYQFLINHGVDNPVIEYEVFEELMSERISWSGNIRQLEGVARNVASEAIRRNRSFIRHDMLRDVLKRMKLLD